MKCHKVSLKNMEMFEKEMTKTYADICLERAEKATEGPWKLTENEINIALLNKPILQTLYGVDGPNAFVSFQSLGEAKPDAEFIAHARTDVPELAKRLKKACEAIRDVGTYLDVDDFKALQKLADELEAMPEIKERGEKEDERWKQ